MLNMTLSQIGIITKGRLVGEDRLVSSVAIDSRSVKNNGLFVAIKGEVVDGHNYLQQAMELGASGALVERYIDHPIPQVVVSNTMHAIADIAREYRKYYKGSIVSITGSSGKTSTKEMIVSILSTLGKVIATQGNQNNELGVPLTLFNLDDVYPFAVVEMGAAQKGDIAYLVDIANPDVVAITNVGSAHIGRFGSEAVIAATKSEIYTESGSHARAVVNLDDKYAGEWLQQLAFRPVTTFSLFNNQANLYVSDIGSASDSSSFVLHHGVEHQQVTLQVPGMHNISNALCAAACAVNLGISLGQIVSGLNAFQSVSSRLQKLQGFWGGVLIDDCYNANPGSVRAAIDVLSRYSSSKILVLGDMAELGDSSKFAHEEVGSYAKQQGINYLYTCGIDSEYASKAFGENSVHFNNKPALISFLKAHLVTEDNVLVKGSRSAALEEVVQSIMAKVAA